MKVGLQSTLAKKIGRRYSRALFNAAVENKTIEGVNADIISLAETLKTSKDLNAFITAPYNPPELFEAVLKELFKDKVQAATYDFLLLLIKKGRLIILNEILASFMSLYHEYHRITKIQIISAMALLPEQVDAICKKLQMRHNHEYFAETMIDPDLIGGFQIKSGDEVLDFSMKNQLENFRRQVINA